MKNLKTEWEVVFPRINKEEIREKLRANKAKLVIPEKKQIRKVFYLPDKEKNGYVRVRKEIDGKTRLAFKVFLNEKVSGQKELEITVSDFAKTVELLQCLGIKEKSFQETKRELWKMGETEIMIDEWPFLEPFIEIEGKNEEAIKEVAKKLGFDYSQGIFGPVSILYAEKYHLPEEKINKTPKIVFGKENPFLKKKNEKNK